MASILETDGYKFSMAEAGWPLRTETFYYSHRKGGCQLLPFDVEKFIRSILPKATEEDYAFLNSHDYATGPGYKAAMVPNVITINALPRETRFFPKEPVFSVTGPSALVSWLEPLVLQTNYRIQIATAARGNPDFFRKNVEVVTCERQREIIEETLTAVGVTVPKITVDSDRYFKDVLDTVKQLVRVVKDPNRIFEVGMRSVTCMEQHEIALSACLSAGVTRTSNVFLAKKLGMAPVGTMGHEHVQRYGSDEDAFRAMRDRRPYRSSYLLDTFDTYLSGIPAAFKVMSEDTSRQDSIRYDSGNKMCQYLYAVSKAKGMGLRPIHVIEDGLALKETIAFENVREETGVKADEQFYGYGGFIVSPMSFGVFKRDRVAAVYKLSQSGPYPVMKFSDEQDGGKESIPGKPVIFRRASATGPVGFIGQEDERCPDGYTLISGTPLSNVAPSFTNDRAVGRSDETRALTEKCRMKGGTC